MTIVTEIFTILKSGNHLSDLEEQLSQLMREQLRTSLTYCLELLDKEIIRPYCEAGWQIDRLEKRQMTFLFGTVSFKRRRLRKKGEKSFIPLDEALGIEKRQQFSPLFREKSGQLVTGMTFRQASQSLELLTEQSMSHQTLHQMTQKVAEKIKEVVPDNHNDLRSPKVLYIEADGVWIGSQEKGKHLEFKRGFIHEGIDRTGKRAQLIAPVYFGCFGRSRDLFQQISEYLQSHYNLRQTIVIANSDGGSGYESDKFEQVVGGCRRFHYCLDSYHVMRYITGKLGFDKGLQSSVRQAVKAYDRAQIDVMIDTAESFLENEDYLTRLLELKAYLNRHWFAIKPLNQRGIEVSDGVGVCESGHRFYTNRLKRQGRNWSQEGAENMAYLLTAKRNGTFEQLYRASHAHKVFEPEVGMSSAKALKKVKHEEHTIPTASITLNGATSTPIGQLKKWI